MEIEHVHFISQDKLDDIVGRVELAIVAQPISKDVRNRQGGKRLLKKYSSTKKVAIDILLGAHAARLMHGARVTCCKSGKDRTGAAVTLEMAEWTAMMKFEVYYNLTCARIS